MGSQTHASTDRSLVESSLTGFRLDAIVTVLSFLMVAGVALDFRAHNAGISFAEEGFLTPEHTFFYSMFLGIAAVISAATYRERRRGVSWIAAVPDGYGWSVVGVAVFGLGGVGDFLWHSTFGFEESVEALVSPTHLMLATGAVLFLASPLRAAWRRETEYSGLEALPAVISAALSLTILTLFTVYANPVSWPAIWAEGQTAHQIGMVGFIVYSALLVGTALSVARGFDLPFGSFTLLFTVPTLAAAAFANHSIFLVSAVLAGLVADGIARYRRPIPTNLRTLRAFSALVPMVFAASYVALASVVSPLGWAVHVWSGAAFIAGATGLLLSYVASPDATEVG